MRTGIVGSRGFEDYHYLAECLDNHPVPITTIVSGGAKGVDELAERYANERGFLLKPISRNIAPWENPLP